MDDVIHEAWQQQSVPSRTVIGQPCSLAPPAELCACIWHVKGPAGKAPASDQCSTCQHLQVGCPHRWQRTLLSACLQSLTAIP